jgi:hypothetical protein
MIDNGPPGVDSGLVLSARSGTASILKDVNHFHKMTYEKISVMEKILLALNLT